MRPRSNATALAMAALAVSLLLPPTGRPEASTTCTCMSPKRPVCEVWWQTAAIFVGRVTQIRTIEDETSDGQRRLSTIVRLRVSERWMGLRGRGRDVEVRTGTGGGDCGFQFERGKTYLVYASQSSSTGRLETGICSRTAHVEDAEQDLAYLRGIENADPVVSLYGMVYRERQVPAPGEEVDAPLDPGGPLPDVSVRLSGAATETMTRSDAEGWYEFDGLPAGSYEVRLEGDAFGDTDVWNLDIPRAPACIWRNIIVEPLPRGGGGAEARPQHGASLP